MRKKLYGMSLLELLISISLSLFLVSCLLSVYALINRQVQVMKDKLDKVLEIGGVQHLFRDSIRRAGFTPCMPISSLKTEHLVPFSIQGVSLTLNRMDEQYQIVSVVDERTLLSALPVFLGKSRSYLLADCYHAEVVLISSIHAKYIYLSKPLRYHYQAPVYVGRWLREIFFISPPPSALMYQQFKTVQKLSQAITKFIPDVDCSRKTCWIEIVLNQAKIRTRIRAI